MNNGVTGCIHHWCNHLVVQERHHVNSTIIGMYLCLTCTRFQNGASLATGWDATEQSAPMMRISVSFLLVTCCMNPCTASVASHWRKRNNGSLRFSLCHDCYDRYGNWSAMSALLITSIPHWKLHECKRCNFANVQMAKTNDTHHMCRWSICNSRWKEIMASANSMQEVSGPALEQVRAGLLLLGFIVSTTINTLLYVYTTYHTGLDVLTFPLSYVWSLFIFCFTVSLCLPFGPWIGLR